MPPGAGVLTVEFKVNMLAPAKGERLIARGEVLKPGRTLSIVRADVWALEDGRETLIAAMQQTLMVMHGMEAEPRV
jgi:acyl-coenzyme A thioesterase PaaI-like protein